MQRGNHLSLGHRDHSIQLLTGPYTTSFFSFNWFIIFNHFFSFMDSEVLEVCAVHETKVLFNFKPFVPEPTEGIPLHSSKLLVFS